LRMRFFKKLLKILGYMLAAFLLLIIVFCIYVWKVSDIKPPVVADTTAVRLTRKHVTGSLYTIGDNWIRKNKYGLYEMYVSGAPFELGVKNGKLSQELIMSQEEAFTHEIKRMIPSSGYLKFLKYMVGFVNRGLPGHVNEEYKDEIYGESFSAADSFSWIGTNYARLLNYHAAHDVGHALQNMMLVGCSSFGAWDTKTANGSMLLGRNFDFWVGDDFAVNKMVAFYKPEKGYRFAFITWGGFTGVVSGMNEKGLTVTINAAKSAIPTNAATPVSLVAREILQYATNTDEAIKIAHQREMFVSESFLIGSAKDHKAIIIEKTPDTLAVYDPKQDHILCTNHYQSDFFANEKRNLEQKEKSASVYRYQRLYELMQENYPLTPEKIATILRDRKGLHGANIGEGNEKAVNQLIAHHSVIFQPDSLRMWVSTQPWQLGEYVCYDLRKIFALQGLQQDTEIADEALNIAPDPYLQTDTFKHFQIFRANKMALLQQRAVDTGAVVRNNPLFYDAYRIAGDYCRGQKWYAAAIKYYNGALQQEIATLNERDAILHKIADCQKKMQH